MNKAAKLVASLVTGTRGKGIVIGGKTYFMASPTLRTLCRALNEFADIGIDYGKPLGEELARLPQAVPHIARGIAITLTPNASDKAIDKTTEELMQGTPVELAAAMSAFIMMTSLQEVFQLAASATKYAEAAAREKRK